MEPKRGCSKSTHRIDENRQLQPSVHSNIIETREKLAEMADLVSEKEQDSKADQKRYYDRNARNRAFEVGDKVLVLLPTST